MATKISELPTGQKVGNVLDETLQIGGGATTATTASLTIPRTSATTNTVEPLLALNRQSSGTPANGIGASLVFDVETAAGNTERGATIEAVTTDVTAASEDFDLVFKTMAAGAGSSERARVGSDGQFSATFLYSAGGVIYDGLTGFREDTAGVYTGSGRYFGWRSGTATGGVDTSLARNAAGVIRSSTTGTTINGFLGGGAAVASAAALPVPTGRVFHVTGTTGITSITSTNFGAGAVITMIFDGILTVSDGNNLKLAGAFVTAADSTLTLAYDGSNWYEVARSTN